MYECRIAYRWTNGEMEGFKGIGFNTERARQDAINQIGRKIALFTGCKALRDKVGEFEHSQIVKSFTGLTNAEKHQIRTDWTCELRY